MHVSFPLTAVSVVHCMLTSKNEWNEECDFAAIVLKELGVTKG